MELFESTESKAEKMAAVPRPGEYKVEDTSEVKEAGGLLVRDFEELEGGKYKAARGLIDRDLVRLPAGAVVTVEKVFADRSGKGLALAPDGYGIISIKGYHGDILKGCVNMSYLSKAPTASALGDLRQELEG